MDESKKYQLPDRSRALIQQQQAALTTTIYATREALGVPTGYMLSRDASEFVPVQPPPEETPGGDVGDR